MAVKDVAVTFDASGKITVSPDPVRVDWRTEDGLQWKLEASDTKAVLEGIVFKEHSKGPPFASQGRHPSDPTIWKCSSCRRVRAVFKYDVIVRDGEGNLVILDPSVMVGDPPGRPR